jgi:GNAT superfamily N-acetyltransferase
VHVADGYPRRWPADAAAWLTPPGIIDAWVATDEAGTVAGHVCLVGDVDDPVVAAAAGIETTSLATVSRLFVVPLGRGRRLGAVLLETLTEHAAASGLRAMLDVVDDGGAAIRLYDRLGWRLVDERAADWVTLEGLRLPLRIYLSPAV